MVFGGRRVMTSMAMVAAIGGGALGCSSAPASEPERAAPPTAPAETSSTSTSTSTTSTTEPPRRFEPLLADPDQNIRDQVEAAYLHHWDVLNEAGRTGRTDDLHLVFEGDLLQLRVADVERLVAEGIRVQGHLEHNFEITVVEDDLAVVMDAQRTFLVQVDSSSGVRLSEPTGREMLNQYDMRKVDGRWVVARVVVHER